MARRNEDIDRRLSNWARWRHGMTVGGLGYASVDMASEGIRETAEADVRLPLDDVEAEETNRAVLALPGELRATVEEVYLRGGSMAIKAKRLCCAEPTIYARLVRADTALQVWLAAVQAQRKEARRRLEAMQASARPTGTLDSFTS